MTDGLSEPQVKWLTYLVYILLSTLAVSNGWLIIKQSELPDQFVRLERYTSDRIAEADRYQCDMTRIEKALESIDGKFESINNKLDRNFRNGK